MIKRKIGIYLALSTADMLILARFKLVADIVHCFTKRSEQGQKFLVVFLPKAVASKL